MTNQTSNNNNNLDTQPLTAVSSLSDGKVLADRFLIIKSLGNGAQADVYLALDQLLEVEVAIKVISDQVNQISSLSSIRNEVLIARKLQHPNIVRVFDVFEDNDLVFFTMEYIEGELLIDRLMREISKDQFERWAKQLFEAMHVCDSAEVKHGDIKPDNILIDKNNNVRLIDFGIGQVQQEQSQTSGHPEFSAPEVIHAGKSSRQSEIYSVGKVLLLMLTALPDSARSLTSARWYRKQQQFLARLTHIQAEKRPSITNAISFYSAQSYSHVNKSIVSISLLLILILCFAFIYLTNPAKITLPNKTIQIALVNAPQSPLLSELSEILNIALQANPQLALVSSHQTTQTIANMSLNPTITPKDRVTLATTLALEAMVVLTIVNIDDNNFLIRANTKLYPEDLTLFNATYSVNANTLQQDLREFSDIILKEFSRHLNTPIESIKDANSNISRLYLSAENSYFEGDIEATRQALNSIFEQENPSLYWLLKGRVLQGELNDDLVLAKRSIEKLVSLHPNRADLLAQKASIHQWADEGDLAIESYRLAISINPNNGQLWFELAKLKIIAGDTRSAIKEELTHSLVAFRRVGDIKGEALVLNAFGVAHLRLAEYELSQRYFRDSLELRNPRDYPKDRANTLANYANVTAIIGQFTEARSALEEASMLLEKIGDKAEQAHIQNTLGFLHEEQGLYFDALTYYKVGLDIRVALKSSSIEQAESMSNVAYMYFLIGDFSLADIYWQQARILFEKSNDSLHLLRTLQNLAQLSLVKGDDLVATRYLNTVSHQMDASHQQELMINNLLYSYYHFANGKLSAAIEQIIAAKKVAEQTNDGRAITELYLWHGEICLLIADAPCVAEQTAKARVSMPNNMNEQKMVLAWLELSLNSLKSEIDQTVPDDLLYQLKQANIPVLTELKILLDLQERLRLPLDGDIMIRINKLIKPIYYQQYMNYLYIWAIKGEKLNSLKQQLVAHPNFWRNHLFYKLLPNEAEKQTQLQQEWLSQLTEKQRIFYQAHYIE